MDTNTWLNYIKDSKKEISASIALKLRNATKGISDSVGKEQLYKLVHAEGKEDNRYLIASKDIKAGQLIFSQQAITFAINQKFHTKICHNCFGPNKLKVCSACNVSLQSSSLTTASMNAKETTGNSTQRSANNSKSSVVSKAPMTRSCSID